MELLRQWMGLGRPIGFCPWDDADAILWGYLRSVDAESYTVQEVSTLGQLEKTETYTFAQTSYFDTDPVYAQRLVQLAKLRPRWPEEPTQCTRKAEIRAALTEAARTREVIRVKVRGTSYSLTVLVVTIDDEWVQFIELDDLARENRRSAYRLNLVRSVRWRSRSEEADMFLRNTVK